MTKGDKQKKVALLGYGVDTPIDEKPRYRTIAVSKKVGIISNAYVLIRNKYPNNKWLARYPKTQLYDAYNNILFHDENYYFEIEL